MAGAAGAKGEGAAAATLPGRIGESDVEDSGHGHGAGPVPLAREKTISRQNSQTIARSTSAGSGGVLRSISARVLEGVGALDRTFCCEICFENVRTATDSFALEGCSEHMICKGCFKEYIETSLKRGVRVDKLSCPGGDECGAIVTDTDVVRLCGTRGDVTKLYRDFAAKQSDAGASDCPKCGTTVPRNPSDPADPILECPDCAERFCFFHSAAHGPDETCEAFLRRTAAADAAAKRAMRSECAFCPKCGVATIRISGCNHMTCSKCGQNYCYLCLQMFSSSMSEDHFALMNPYGCPGLQFAPMGPGSRVYDEAAVRRAERCMTCLSWTRIILCPVFLALALVLGIVGTGLGCAFLFLGMLLTVIIAPFANLVYCIAGWDRNNLTDHIMEFFFGFAFTLIMLGPQFGQFAVSGPQSFVSEPVRAIRNAPRD